MTIEKIAILDCGGQYTKVIDRKVRELNVRSDIFPLGIKANQLKEYNGIILSGGPKSVWSEEKLLYDPALIELGMPVLGICYGMHLLNTHFGGAVKPGVKTEYGETEIETQGDCPLFSGLSKKETVLMSHGDSVKSLAPGFSECARSGDVIAAFYNAEKKIYGVQFHPEVDLTVHGKKILSNFLMGICELHGNYRLEDRIEVAVQKIKTMVKDNEIVVLVSGGVDSAVSAVLLLKALDKMKIHAIHIDHGFMRKNESDDICENLKRLGLNNLIRINAAEIFFNTICTIENKKLGPLTSITDPEEKRTLIGHLFIEVLKEALKDLNLDFDSTFLAQGTLRPDLIESGNPDVSSYAHKIKTHHNDVEIIRKAREKGLIVETNWDWHKDEVRQVGRSLGLEDSITKRQPFPGPGLAIRIICTDGKETIPPESSVKCQAEIDKISGNYNGFVLPFQTVGVQGDCRSYRNLVFLSSPHTPIEWNIISKIGNRLPNKLNFINRVAYVLNKEVTGALSIFPQYLTKPNVHLLQEVDAIIRKYLENDTNSQVFGVLVPVGITKKVSVAIRTFITNDYMTGRPAILGKEIPLTVISDLIKEIETHCPEIDMIAYDITSKPPATVEWE